MTGRVFISGNKGLVVYSDTKLCRFITGGMHESLKAFDKEKFESHTKYGGRVTELTSTVHMELAAVLKGCVDDLGYAEKSYALEVIEECILLDIECKRVKDKWKREGGAGNVIFCDEEKLRSCHE